MEDKTTYFLFLHKLHNIIGVMLNLHTNNNKRNYRVGFLYFVYKISRNRYFSKEIIIL